MRYVPSLPPATAPAVTEEPRPLRAVAPVRRIEPRIRVPRVVQRFKQKAEKPDEAAGETAARPERRSGSDRRVVCRRVQRGSQAFLDTRSGVERRKNQRRSSDVATVLDEEG
ncbi:MAG: hypothetical protein ACM3JK_00500 [Betaproteobacteria bacterium]